MESRSGGLPQGDGSAARLSSGPMRRGALIWALALGIGLGGFIPARGVIPVNASVGKPVELLAKPGVMLVAEGVLVVDDSPHVESLTLASSFDIFYFRVMAESVYDAVHGSRLPNGEDGFADIVTNLRQIGFFRQGNWKDCRFCPQCDAHRGGLPCVGKNWVTRKPNALRSLLIDGNTYSCSKISSQLPLGSILHDVDLSSEGEQGSIQSYALAAHLDNLSFDKQDGTDAHSYSEKSHDCQGDVDPEGGFLITILGWGRDDPYIGLDVILMFGLEFSATC